MEESSEKRSGPGLGLMVAVGVPIIVGLLFLSDLLLDDDPGPGLWGSAAGGAIGGVLMVLVANWIHRRRSQRS